MPSRHPVRPGTSTSPSPDTHYGLAVGGRGFWILSTEEEAVPLFLQLLGSQALLGAPRHAAAADPQWLHRTGAEAGAGRRPAAAGGHSDTVPRAQAKARACLLASARRAPGDRLAPVTGERGRGGGGWRDDGGPGPGWGWGSGSEAASAVCVQDARKQRRPLTSSIAPHL